MKGRLAIAVVPGLVILVYLGVIIYQSFQLNALHKKMQVYDNAGIRTVQLADHNLDSLSYSLNDYSNAIDEREKAALKNLYVMRYDVIDNIFNPARERFSGHLLNQPGTKELIEDVLGFLHRYEPIMHESEDPDTRSLRSMAAESRELSARSFDLTQQILKHQSVLKDDLDSTVQAQLLLSWIGGFLFVICMILTGLLLKALTDNSQTTQTRLSSALDEASASDRERQALNSFVAAASHDLRQPLHALGLYLAALKGHISTPQGRSILDNSFRSAEALNHLLNSMLDLSKLDAGVVEINLDDVELNEMFLRLRQTYLPDARQRELRLYVHHTDLVVHTDPVLLERILGNLLSNALTYTESGSVSIKAVPMDDKVEIAVSDTGPGIPEHEHQQIYDEFYQLDNPERDRTKGLGLGLSIVKRLTGLLKIDLDLESAPAEGSTFTLSLQTGDMNQISKSHGQSSGAVQSDLNGLSILVIDDESDVRDGMGTLLEQYRCDVVSVDSADSGLTHIIDNEWVPDLIIADYRLRDEKRGDVAIQLVREEVNEDVPAMIVTGDTSPARLKEAAASGFTLLHKPVMANVLMDKINKLMGEHA